ncbi:hypothetical protein C8K30_102536 [Promicromonospora sp. AC04]|uniref:hypothetical protein n=1 Tax=Promicromonospora sp. AC04 TaxID=2135723 RepID=UPI000D4BC094|nr:hypothetical protein [Promicromonospora sp. AC04]PUB30154.1 hypothetical protein C8K30_102536 [Promicromonospora sp. AC04]
MNKLAEKALIAQIAVQAYVVRQVERARSDERGQGTVEYVGAILLVVAIVVVVIAAGDDVGKAIVEKLKAAVKKIGSGD